MRISTAIILILWLTAAAIGFTTGDKAARILVQVLPWWIIFRQFSGMFKGV